MSNPANDYKFRIGFNVFATKVFWLGNGFKYAYLNMAEFIFYERDIQGLRNVIIAMTSLNSDLYDASISKTSQNIVVKRI